MIKRTYFMCYVVNDAHGKVRLHGVRNAHMRSFFDRSSHCFDRMLSELRVQHSCLINDGCHVQVLSFART